MSGHSPVMTSLKKISLFLLTSISLLAGQPAVGEPAQDFTLKTVDGKAVRLSELTPVSPVVLVVLRGFPGYQCPYCQLQVRDFTRKAQAFVDAGVQVVFVYPGPVDKASEAIAGKDFPSSMKMLVDPDYAVTKQYGLRWDAAKETAYPSTFLLDTKGVIYFASIAKMHGGRTSATEILELLPKKK